MVEFCLQYIISGFAYIWNLHNFAGAGFYLIDASLRTFRNDWTEAFPFIPNVGDVLVFNIAGHGDVK